ncbi:MAG: hypothetical protein KVP17_003778 [Porospora cf. gigantea B]|uniref:uncharacterized protein n=1 Tax=Porospora cf. gigantea B TaxID=2853592 RepID=UPI003571838B|nr:MAG: hypothetical protein KVP17_003778 [Porospora cf. gigantea B]
MTDIESNKRPLVEELEEPPTKKTKVDPTEDEQPELEGTTEKPDSITPPPADDALPTEEVATEEDYEEDYESSEPIDEDDEEFDVGEVESEDDDD